ncbi:MAG: DHA2 family efflux MFS transporter permease subunit [Novosphingobium sp.]
MSAAATEAAPPAGYVEVHHKTLLTLATMAAMIMQILDATIANVALPHVQASLGATQESISWVLTSYIIASAVVLPLLGWLAARFGIRKVFVVSVVVFTIASAACGLAQNIGQLVLFRVLQGVGGAFLSPLAQTIMLDINPPEKRARAMGLFAQGVMLGPIAGPVLGGYLTENFDWRWVFYVNVPIGIAAVVVLLATMPRLPRQARRFDVFGWALIAVALAGLQLLLDRGQSKDWFDSAEIVVWAGLFAAGTWMFFIHMATKRDPLFPREVFRDRNLMLALGFFFLIGLVMLSVMALLPALLQSIYGYPAIQAGWLLTPRGIGILVTMAFVTKVTDKVDARMLMAAGLAIAAYSLHMMSGWGPDIPRSLIISSGFIQGLGLGLAFTPINILAFATLEPRLRTDAASLVNLFRNLGASSGIAVSSVLLARSIQVNHAEISANLTRTALPIDVDQLRRFGPVEDMGMSMVDALVNRQAVMIGYINDFHAMSIACLLAIPLVFFLRKPPVPDAAVAPKPAGAAG